MNLKIRDLVKPHIENLSELKEIPGLWHFRRDIIREDKNILRRFRKSIRKIKPEKIPKEKREEVERVLKEMIEKLQSMLNQEAQSPELSKEEAEEINKLIRIANGKTKDFSAFRSRRDFLKKAAAISAVAAVAPTELAKASSEYKLDIRDHYTSKDTKVRSSTSYIILHTTEAGDNSSLNSVTRHASCNYLVMSDGHVKRIVNIWKLANHAGVSMWNGITNISDHSIGIEIAGYHNEQPSWRQKRAIRELLRQLQKKFNIADRDVLPHSAVAYAQNKWHPSPVRVRKPCAMLYHTESLREQIGLKDKYEHDPDINAGRISWAEDKTTVMAKDYLYETNEAENKVEDIARKGGTVDKDHSPFRLAGNAYNSPSTIYIFPDGNKKKGSEIRDWSSMPAGTKIKVDSSMLDIEEENVEFYNISEENPTPFSVAGNEYDKKTTIYFIPVDDEGTEKVMRGDQIDEFNNIPAGTRVLVGFTDGGKVSGERSADDICGKRWDNTDTIYRLPDGEILNGEQIEQSKIKPGTWVFFRR
ncbi:MAG: N-acetylmuramoyl-L-alanine amidase [Nanobdellota archaeon]